MKYLHFALIFVSLFPVTSHSYTLAADHPRQSIAGKVVGLTDGDTIDILVDKTKIRIRLNGIDAPESKPSQAFGTKAKEHLADLVFGKTVRVEPHDKDRYGRTIGDVFVDGKWVNLQMVKDGFAWHYKQYSKDKDLAAAEMEARRKKLGLWADNNPTPPWEFRRGKAKAKGTRPVESKKM